jgi:chemosensory pili system protein ChpA (sensor histidine kinase/response regulator)
MNTRAVFDVGPLSWVKGEIDLAMSRGVESLRAFAANPGDATKIKFAQAALHQAHGALEIVGLAGVTRVSEELEGLLGDLEKDSAARTPQNFELATGAVGGIVGFLDSLISGAPNHPLRLFPIYQKLLAARGKPDADPVDLYFPDLSGRPPPHDKSAAGLTPEGLDKHYRDQRGRFQRGLLKWIKGDASGAEDMRAAVEATERAQGATSQRVFWWVALAFFDALVAKAVPADIETKRLCNRIDQQFRRLVEGSQNVAERLLREALYQVARVQPVTPHVRAVQDAYRLEHTLPKEESAQAAPAESASLKPAREALMQAKDAWNKFASGNPSSLTTFRSASSVLKDRIVELGSSEATALARELAVLATWLSGNTQKMSEAIALEVATALLLLENALANLGSLGADFVEQSQFVCARLRACVLGKLLRTAPSIPLLDEMSRKAQERLVLNQVVSEMQANLRSIEQVLDTFFRDPAKRGDLTVLSGPLHQVKGALDMLGEPRARDSLGECEAEVRRFAYADYAPHQEDFERIAQILAGLGFYIEALAVGKADFDVAMNPITAKRPAEDLVAIGEETVSKSLFDIFVTEAASHLQTMAQEREVLSQQAVITDALMGAAHALPGICTTVKVDAVRDLGHALEQALQRLSATTLSEAEDRLIGEAIGALSTMVGEAQLKYQPARRTDLVERLRRAGIPPLVECAATVLLPEEEGALSREPEAILIPPAAPTAPPPAEVVRETVSPPGALAPEELPIERRQPRMRDELDP